VRPGGTADRAGITGGNERVFFGNRPLIVGGDVIVELAGKPIKSGDDVANVLEDKRPGEKVQMVYFRNGRKETRTIELVSSEAANRRFRF